MHGQGVAYVKNRMMRLSKGRISQGVNYCRRGACVHFCPGITFAAHESAINEPCAVPAREVWLEFLISVCVSGT